ncbi:MAG: hypothetical protein P4L50_15935 [Anaerolineaceae bacterium]|nr:hypothetical protein [Anaerolineaceae bacterium]
MPNDLTSIIRRLLHDPCAFAQETSGITLRQYQVNVAQAIYQSVINSYGDTIVIMFPRQSGKNELQAQVETFLLTIYSQMNAEMIKVSPTWKPQTLNAMSRLERTLEKNLLIKGLWKKESGFIYRHGTARMKFLSGGPEANIVGATASTLLEVDEAQDIQISKFDKDIAPMAASTNATRVFWGTAWTSNTLLAREKRSAQAAQDQDGRQRVFVLTAADVAKEVPAYGLFVADQVQKLGRNNPMVRTQYFSEEIDSEGGMFPPARLALIRGSHARLNAPEPNRIYALLLDVAGEDEGVVGVDGIDLANPGRDSTALTVVEVDLSTMADPVIHRPTYKVVDRKTWIGVKHINLYGQIKALADLWRARYLVVDATGIGAGIASFLAAAMPSRVLPFLFNSSTKSKLGWDFLAAIETGRFKNFAGEDPEGFTQQLAACQMTVVPGPDHKIKWGTPEGARDPATGDYQHDDLVLSAALVGVLDEQEWSFGGPALVVRPADPLLEMDQGF